MLRFESNIILELTNPYTNNMQAPTNAKPDGNKDAPGPGEIRYKFVSDPATTPGENRTYFSVIGYDNATRVVLARHSNYLFVPADPPAAKQAR